MMKRIFILMDGVGILGFFGNKLGIGVKNLLIVVKI